ncbi:MAG: extracellular solute-binding protein [Spirochaetales bacterium]|nr:extracellular solute-binding protein [Spirochaetales bacterium]
MKRLFAVLLVLVVAAAIVSAAGAPEAAPKADEPITLRYWTHEDANRQAFEDELIAEFQKTHPNVTIEHTVVPTKKRAELIQTAFAANNGPDIFTMPIEDAYQYILDGRVTPVDYAVFGAKNATELADQYLGTTMSPATVGGDIYGVPLEITNYGLYVNKRVFRDAGLDADKDYPKTWEDLLTLSEKICKYDGQILTVRAVDFNYDHCFVQFQSLIEQMGGKILSDDGKEAIVGEEAWLRFFRMMHEFGPAGKNYASPSYTYARKLFNAANGDIAMAFIGLYQVPRILNDNPEFYNSGDWMIVPFPKMAEAKESDPRSCYLSQYYYVNAQSSPAAQKAAWEFLAFCQSKPEEYLGRGGSVIQPRKSVLESAVLDTLPYSDVVLDGLAESKASYCEGGAKEIEALFLAALTDVMDVGVSPEEAYKTLKEGAQAVIDEL